MSFITRLEYLMKKNGIKNNAELAKLSGVPYTTIDGFYKKGTDNIKLSTLKKLTKCLHCSLDFLTDEVKPVTTLAAHLEGEDFTVEEYVDFYKDCQRSAPEDEEFAALTEEELKELAEMVIEINEEG